MTADDWLQSTDLEQMLGSASRRLNALSGGNGLLADFRLVFSRAANLRTHRSSRKFWLFSIACCRHACRITADDECSALLDVADQFIDGAASESDWRGAIKKAGELWDRRAALAERDYRVSFKVDAVRATWMALKMQIPARLTVPGPFFPPATLLPSPLWRTAYEIASEAELVLVSFGAQTIQQNDEEVFQCKMVRDVFGGPEIQHLNDSDRFRRSATVISLAQAVHADGQYDRMPILADALIDSGCVDEPMLRHCRETDSHVRGCWVIDWLLEKN